MRLPAHGGALVIDQPTVGGPDDGTVVPFARSGARDDARDRHPASHRARDARRDDDLDAESATDDGLPHERTIASGLVEGRRWALAAAFERWSGLVHGIARRYVGHDDADDVTQQVFVEAWRSRRSFSPERGEVPGWLVGITRNVARARLRARGPATTEVDELLDADEGTRVADAVVDGLLVATAFRDLSADHREVLELTLVEQFTHTEVAARLGIPLGTVKARHRRGLAALRRALGVDDR